MDNSTIQPHANNFIRSITMKTQFPVRKHNNKQHNGAHIKPWFSLYEDEKPTLTLRTLYSLEHWLVEVQRYRKRSISRKSSHADSSVRTTNRKLASDKAR